MELGNMVFGNSRGEYPVPRSDKWEDELFRLFESYAPERDNSWREYGEEFENDIFSVFPYYWGDCTCGHDDRVEQWSKENKHEEHCYQTALKKAQGGWLENNPEPEAQMFNTSSEEIEVGVTLITSEPSYSPSADMWRKWYNKKEIAEKEIYDRLCAEFVVNRKFGCAIHCTCGYEKQWERFCEISGHVFNCPIVKPNFLYKPTNFSIKWYKYPLRDSYMSQKITLKKFRDIISKCIESL